LDISLISERIDQITALMRQSSHLCLLPNWLREIEQGEWQQIALAKSAKDEDVFYFEDDRTVHLKQVWRVPEYIDKLPIQGAIARLNLVWWAAKAEVLIDGNKVQTGDLFDQKCRIQVSDNLQCDRNFTFELRLEKPNHDRGALQASEIIIEYPRSSCDPGKFADELSVIQAYLPILKTHGFELEDTITELESLLQNGINHECLDGLADVRRSLFPIGQSLKCRKVYMLGNAHIDIAWLWRISETKDVLKRTFSSVLSLQNRYAELIFNQSSALSYEWIEQEEPELFAQIQTAISHKTWEPTGGMWIEPDCNLPSGESLIRQIVFGKKYFLEKFDWDVKIAWLPDTFGFNWQLPQILKKSGFEAFITQKLAWNDTNKFPAQIFWWQGLDGSEILTYFSNDIGAGIEPVEIAKFLAQQESQHHIQSCLWLYGVGDHGGGPTADMLDLGREWQASDLFFEIAPTTAENFIGILRQELDVAEIPTWRDELYLEFHRGTYTSKADQKLKHRRTEILLTNTEKYRAVLSIYQNVSYPIQQLEQAWKELLLNQFHDILPGTSIPEVYTDADQTWDEVERICHNLLDQHLDQNKQLNVKYLWNFHNWECDQIIAIADFTDSSDSKLFVQFDVSGSLLPTQRTEAGLIFRARHIPSMGASGFRIIAGDQVRSQSVLSTPPISITPTCLENQYLKVSIDPELGEISQILDKRYDHQLLESASELQFYADKGQYWDAWNIDPEFEHKKLDGLTLESIQVKEEGEIRVSLQIVRRFQRSRFVQEIQLEAHSPYITVKTWVDWQEQHVLVKVDFPLSWRSPFATYEIPMGAIARSTLGETSEAKAKFEVPAQFWADMSGDGIGLSVLNDCKYGYDAKPNHLRLSLLRSPQWPCPDSDRGIHEFTYRLLPHQGSWQAAHTVQRGYELNNPLTVHELPFECDRHNFSLLSTSSHQVILSAFKLSEDQTSWILRFYESHGQKVQEVISFSSNIASVQECDLLENYLRDLQHQDNQFCCEFQPFEIKTFMVQFNQSGS
jgi:alpha-mannosidase